MGGQILIYVGSAMLIAWGLGHIIPTRNVVAGFGSISAENKRIVTMAWVSEGLTLIFIGLLVLLTNIWAGPGNPVSVNVCRLSAITLVILAGWTLFTGARTKVVPMKICPFVKLIAAALFFVGGGL